MKILDVTVGISTETPVYEGDPPVAIESVSRIADGANANVSNLCLGAHTGTHVDAPNHFIDSTRRVDDLDLEMLIGRCRVVEIDRSVIDIEPEHLPDLNGIERIIFKTRNSDFWNTPGDGFRTDFTSVAPATAKVLVEKGIKLVGIDYLSLEKFGSHDFATHIALLEREVVILEGLDLRSVPAGDYEIICLPLKYSGGTGDGAPARTILRTLD
jgi:arylformamidase